MSELQKQAAEKAFIEFIRQLNSKQAKGFISESKNGKIYSFETYLRETARSSDEIAGYCELAKTENMLQMAARKGRKFSIYLEKGFLKGLLFLIMIVLVPALLIYLIAATLLLIFNISLWNGSSFLSFTGIAAVVVLVVLILKPTPKGKAKRETTNGPPPLYVIKYFDNEELLFAKAKSRLFVEKSE